MTKENYEVINKIMDRAEKLKCISKTAYPRMTLSMDLENVNEEIALDFDKLLATDDFNFVHDICGIQGHINRQTKKLENFFLPRCAKPTKPIRIVGVFDSINHCSMCDGNLDYTIVADSVRRLGRSEQTHIWTCTQCANTMLEYFSKEDTERFAEFLNGDYSKEREEARK